jgi:phosphatidylglycerophosphatase A
MSVGFLVRNPIVLLATGFGSGLIKVTPGTFGSLVALVLVVLFKEFGSFVYNAFTFVISITSIWICDVASKHFDNKDPKEIVLDEIVGIFICFLFIEPTNTNLLLGFILFRFFDIVKPYPINLIDKKTTGGFGIMADDVIAAVFTLILLHLYVFLF